MTAVLSSTEAEVQGLDAIPDLVARFRKSREIREDIEESGRIVKSAQQAIVLELKEEDRSWREIGELLEISGSRAEQISRGK